MIQELRSQANRINLQVQELETELATSTASFENLNWNSISSVKFQAVFENERASLLNQISKSKQLVDELLNQARALEIKEEEERRAAESAKQLGSF